MKEILEHDHCFYMLSREDGTGDHYLEVECGTTAVFTMTIKLNKNEIAKYSQDKESIRALAYKILDYPQEYISRQI